MSNVRNDTGTSLSFAYKGGHIIRIEHGEKIILESTARVVGVGSALVESEPMHGAILENSTIKTLVIRDKETGDHNLKPGGQFCCHSEVEIVNIVDPEEGTPPNEMSSREIERESLGLLRWIAETGDKLLRFYGDNSGAENSEVTRQPTTQAIEIERIDHEMITIRSRIKNLEDRGNLNDKATKSFSELLSDLSVKVALLEGENED